MNITKETVKHVAELSRLKIDDEFTDVMCNELNAILEYMNTIYGSVNTADVDETPDAVAVPWRADTVIPSLDRETLLANAPERTDETPIVPKTVE